VNDGLGESLKVENFAVNVNAKFWKTARGKVIAAEGLAVFCVAFLVFRPFAPLGVDPHHDGVVFTTANGVSRGLDVSGDVFTQYGPVSAWIQGIVLRVFGGGLLTIRVASMLVLALTAGLFYAGWRILWGRWVAGTAVTLWICSAYFFAPDMPAIPWNSDYALLIQGGITLLATSAVRTREDLSRRLLFGVGVLVGLLPFTRVNMGILTVAALAALVTLYETKQTARTLLFGFVTGAGMVLLALWRTNSISEWWYQGIIFPRSLYHEQLGSIGLTGLRANALINGMPGIGYVLITVFFLRQFTIEKFVDDTSRSRFRKILAAGTICASLIVIWVWLLWMSDPRGFLSPLTLQWAVILAAPVLGVQLLRSVSPGKSSKIDLVIIVAVIGGSLGQLYPTVDLRHVWWASFPAFGIAIAQLRRLISGRLQLFLLAVLLLLPVGLVSFERRDATIDKYRSSLRYASALNGMKVEDSFARAFQPRFTVIKVFEALYGSRPILNICQDGLFASMGGRFKLPDPYFVYWPAKNFDGNFEARREFVEHEKPFIWMCDPLSDPKTYAAQFGYRLVATPTCVKENPQLQVWPWKSILAVPGDWPELPIEARWNKQVCNASTVES
jgi:hypothetical protein